MRAIAGPLMLVAVAACPFVLAQAFAGGSPARAEAGIAGSVTRSATPLHGLLGRVVAREALLERVQHARVAARRARQGWGYGLPAPLRGSTAGYAVRHPPGL